MGWVKGIFVAFIALVALGLFAGGILFYMFVIDKSKGGGLIQNDIAISQNVTLKKSIKPSNFNASLDISGSSKLRGLENLESNQKNNILQEFNNITTAIKEHESICSGGGFWLGQQDFYDNNVRKKGHNAIAKIECEFEEKDKSAYNDLLNKINKIIESNEYLSLNIGAINPMIKDDDAQKYLQDLRYEMIDKIDAIRAIYESKLKSKCKIVAINFEPANYPYYTLERGSAMLASKADSIMPKENLPEINLPIIKEQEVTSKASVSFSCTP